MERTRYALGELLVGRDSTALTELVKNAYDADATTVEVVGRGLEDEERGTITIIDNGTGMTAEQFRRGYLTIAGRGKGSGERRSTRYGRRFTGEKGIGRLATHKLAHRLQVTSTPGEIDYERGRSRVTARIDWDRIECYETLDELGDDALRVEYEALRRPASAGTVVELTALRHPWSEPELNRFVDELGIFQPPALLTGPLSRKLVSEPVLLKRLPFRDAAHRDPFELHLSGDFDRERDLWTEVQQATNWIIEIESTPIAVHIGIVPTSRTLGETPSARRERLTLDQVSKQQPAFTARILARENVRGTRRTGDFVSQAAGIRVYIEGFRVASYGEAGDDWLELDRTYARRSTGLNFELPGLPAPTGRDAGLKGLPNNAYVGAVLLTHAGAPGLQMLVNREGFIDSPTFDAVRATVRTAINLLTRVRAEHSAPAQHEAGRGPFLSGEIRVRDGLANATDDARLLRTQITDLVSPPVEERATALVDQLNELAGIAEQVITDRDMLRVLAAVGTQMAAFIHETEGLVGASQSITRSLALLAEHHPEQTAELLQVRQVVTDLASRLATQASYLSDTTSAAQRRRRQRLQIGERFAAARGLLQPALDRLDIEIVDAIDADARTAPMYVAELTVILTNLMTNAIKAAGPGGKIRVYARRDNNGLRIRMSNTGRAVDLSEAKQWFRPFASTSVMRVDPLLGQGMGLGLPITRSIVEDYKGSVAFIKPQQSYATTVLVRLP